MQTYALTRSESRLAGLLVKGHGLHHATEAMGITYGTARAYLKGAPEGRRALAGATGFAPAGSDAARPS